MKKNCQILHCGNDTAIVKWTESISSKQMARGGGTVWVVLFRALLCGSQKINKTGINREIFGINNTVNKIQCEMHKFHSLGFHCSRNLYFRLNNIADING